MYPSIDSVEYGLFNYHVRENIEFACLARLTVFDIELLRKRYVEQPLAVLLDRCWPSLQRTAHTMQARWARIDSFHR